MATPGQNGAVDFEESAAPVAPTGVTRVVRKGGQLVQSTDGAAFAALGGGSAADLDSALYTFAVSKYPTINRRYSSPILGPTTDATFTGTGANAGTGTMTAALKGGVVQLSTNAAGTGGVLAHIGREAAASSAVITTNMKTDVPWFIAVAVQIVAGVDANSRASILLQNTTLSQALIFGFEGADSTAFWVLSINGSNKVISTTPVVTGSFILLMMGFDGTTISTWQSTPAGILTAAPTLVATQTNLAAVPTVEGLPFFTLQQTGAIAAKLARVDHIFGAFLGAA